MPVTVHPSPHLSVLPYRTSPTTTADTLLSKSCPSESEKLTRLIRASSHFSVKSLNEITIAPSNNGFVRGAFLAYSGHHHLHIRPEDLWFAVLTQLSFYINANAEELRSVFVSHEGSEIVKVDIAEVLNLGEERAEPLGLLDADFGRLAVMMSEAVNGRLNDKSMLEWVMPKFSTTEEEDRIVASVCMMGGLQKYFTYYMFLRCGLPAVTLNGEREDYVDIKKRLERLPGLGAEPTQWKTLLDPVLDGIINTFDNPDHADVKDFWNSIAHQNGGSGTHYLSGWLTAFCFWDSDGKAMHNNPTLPVNRNFDGSKAGLELDGVLYHRVPADKIPAGFVSCPVIVNWLGTIFHTRMCAGSVGIQAWDPEKASDGQGSEFVTLPRVDHMSEENPLCAVRAVSGWWMYEVETPEEKKAGDKGNVKVDAKDKSSSKPTNKVAALAKKFHNVTVGA
jgi:hypothetical protein